MKYKEKCEADLLKVMSDLMEMKQDQFRETPQKLYTTKHEWEYFVKTLGLEETKKRFIQTPMLPLD